MRRRLNSWLRAANTSRKAAQLIWKRFVTHTAREAGTSRLAAMEGSAILIMVVSTTAIRVPRISASTARRRSGPGRPSSPSRVSKSRLIPCFIGGFNTKKPAEAGFHGPAFGLGLVLVDVQQQRIVDLGYLQGRLVVEVDGQVAVLHLQKALEERPVDGLGPLALVLLPGAQLGLEDLEVALAHQGLRGVHLRDQVDGAFALDVGQRQVVVAEGGLEPVDPIHEVLGRAVAQGRAVEQFHGGLLDVETTTIMGAGRGVYQCFPGRTTHN